MVINHKPNCPAIYDPLLIGVCFCPQGVSVNDQDNFPWDTCWICGDPDNHHMLAHSIATGDGVSRYQIVDIMNANGWTWRNG